MEFVDIDSDGVKDILAYDAYWNDIFWCKNDGLGNFQSPQILITNAYPTDIASADFDNDADNDIAFTSGWSRLRRNRLFGEISVLGHLRFRIHSLLLSEAD